MEVTWLNLSPLSFLQRSVSCCWTNIAEHFGKFLSMTHAGYHVGRCPNVKLWTLFLELHQQIHQRNSSFGRILLNFHFICYFFLPVILRFSDSGQGSVYPVKLFNTNFSYHFSIVIFASQMVCRPTFDLYYSRRQRPLFVWKRCRPRLEANSVTSS